LSVRDISFSFQGSGGALSWTPETDVVLTRACIEPFAGAVDAAISTDPSVDVNNLLSGLVVYNQLIALFTTTQQVGFCFRDFSYPVRLGESVFVTTDSPCTVVVSYDDQLI